MGGIIFLLATLTLMKFLPRILHYRYAPTPLGICTNVISDIVIFKLNRIGCPLHHDRWTTAPPLAIYLWIICLVSGLVMVLLVTLPMAVPDP